MAGELQHAPALPTSGQLTQDEYESITAHTLNNGVAEDLIKYDGTKFVRVPKGADGTYLGYSGGVLGPQAAPGSSPTINRINSSPGNVTVADDIVLIDTTTGPITVILPSMAGATKSVRIKRITDDVNDVTLDAWSTELIELDATYILPGGDRSAVVIIPDLVEGTWWVT